MAGLAAGVGVELGEEGERVGVERVGRFGGEPAEERVGQFGADGFEVWGLAMVSCVGAEREQLQGLQAHHVS